MSTATPRRALIVIDVQNEYFTGRLPIGYPDVHVALANIGRAMDAAHAAGVPVVVVQQDAPVDSVAFAHGSPGWQLHPAVARRPHDHHLFKKLPSAFAGTGLGEWLRTHAIDTITVAGFMTQNCDDTTLRDATQAGFGAEFLVDAAGSIALENRAGRATAEEVHRVSSVVLGARFAAIVTTDEWLEHLRRGTVPARDTIVGSFSRAHLAA